MQPEGKCNVSGFIILGISSIPELQLILFGVFVIIYVLIICGNLTIIVVIWKTPHLHIPMYLLLVNLSCIDIASTTNILPKFLSILFTNKKYISFAGCITQVYTFMSLIATEVILLAAMAYDRYIAICHPLHYITLMPLRQCAGFSFMSWIVGFLDAIGHAVILSGMSFCLNNRVDHVFCDLPPLLKITSSDTSTINLLNYIEGPLLGVTTLLLTLISYIFIISTILKIKSTEGQQKAFSTCTAHLTCVCIFYGSILCLYLKPTASFSPKKDKYLSLLYIVIVPIFNPIIYSLKNEDVKKVLMQSTKKHLLRLKSLFYRPEASKSASKT